MSEPHIIQAKEDKRPKRGAWAPGNYVCVCHWCAEDFIGDKRAMQCADCAYRTPRHGQCEGLK